MKVKMESPGCTQILNSYIDSMSVISSAELRLYLAVARLTWGSMQAKVSLSVEELAKVTGMANEDVYAGLRGACGISQVMMADLQPNGKFSCYLVVPDRGV